MGKLDGKVAVITGASRGIGRDMAVVFAREGAKVVVSARTENEGDFRIPGSIATAVDRIKEEGGEAIGIRCDVTQEDEIQALFDQTVEHYGRLDILVNNAAVLIPGKIEDMQVRHWDLLYRINIRGPFVGCKLVVPQMRKQQYGHIINISSVGAIGPGEGPYTETGGGGTAYGSGKAHMERMTQGMAQEVWQDGIAVNALSPRLAIASEGQRWFRGGKAYSGAREDGIIMGDAGAIMCEQDPKTYTGKILYDEDVLTDAGVTDFSQYTIIADE
ncbi:MAG: SDR family NAD(P)-dependent oxidoreductase [SAR202 cluster bacterium]|jgi:NAD(P)-dependent dehydrogenase (short-subunit alcohol dehydrogenase family)|nr:SDR family NAD(P)-dependent oxidoreductase [SAR202 cluster bacterium]MDP7103069.1 SDR family NAD(P)-dependent oxidoreductase [SAR202 cluster bacterium]MDP7224566.1 SDR family NAD(P)-dependent oxidoreductase [SAR202 cluster bacterium]MDP7413904.1 SDR family NAD(P)-dependent oxidoreductase [SAR202 cluster bacterium]MDP7532767.1 SDR family NAD(P)-dependent oxidoreductase [SAR202 cluster bacterium]|tara:strand:+ start:8271 stop:9089 length:819 start_codon:yes stop_codon:yes gene_type:complete